jgi:hypothetical protein
LWKGEIMHRSQFGKPPALAPLTAIVYLLIVGRTAAEEPAATPRVARLVEQLGSARYSERAAATSELAKLGSSVRDHLEAASQSADPEVRMRAGDLLAQIRTLDLWAPSIIDCRLQNEPVSRVVAFLAEQSGNHIRLSDFNGKFNERPVSLNFPVGTFWQVLDETCRQSSNRIRCHYDTREVGFLLLAGAASTAPTAYAGPCRAQINRLLRTFSDRLDFGDDGPQRLHAFDIDVQMIWEDRFRLVGFRSNPVIVEATTSTGETLTPVQGVAGNWQACGPSTKQLQARLGLSPPPVAAHQLDRLTLRWSLMAIGEMRQLVTNELNEGQRIARDGVQAVIDAVDRRDRDRIEIACVISRDISLPEPAEIVFQEYRLDLHDAEGRAWRNQGSSFLLTDRGVQVRTTFLRDSDQEQPKSLVVHYPGVRSQRDVDFTFLKVPLPRSRPE